jgi:glycyl-tRNA synthetase beta chain
MPIDLLLEVGTEEIPSDYLENGLVDLERLAQTYLEENRIPCKGGLHTYGTPRRLILIGKDVAEKQEDMVREVIGPPKKAAYDKEGNPTNAALGFAKKYGVALDDLHCIETSKGEYLHIKMNIAGRSTKDVLADILPQLITSVPWPKSMRWGQEDFAFVRPVHWILALAGEEVIPLEIGGVTSGNKTRGHRFMAPQIIEIRDLQDYLNKIRENFVIIDSAEREKIIEQDIAEKAKEGAGIPLMDPELVTTVANLVEFPTAVCGDYDEMFLNLPDPVLVTVMKKHQRYFAVQGQDGRLIPHFVAVNNTKARNESVVQKGHERVLKARLSDADFFFHEDRKRRLSDRLNDLKGVIYQAELGTSFAKVERFTRLAEYLGDKIAPEKMDYIRLAARLCKCDLVTNMVTEFPSLQGVIGKEYAILDGHPEEVSSAISEHYLPLRAGDVLPASIIGTIIGLADRMDTIAGCFALNLEPTGAADPFALRRHALAIIRMLEKTDWDISLKDFISRSLDILNGYVDFPKDPVSHSVMNFFKERYKQMMLRSDYESDLIEAVISAEFDRIADLRFRIEQLKTFSTESNEFESLAMTFKRISNILKNQEESLAVDPTRFQEPCESELWNAYGEIKGEMDQLLGKREYLKALNVIARLLKPVDQFFDGVEILLKDNPMLKANRIGILQHLARLFLSLADLSKFSI